LGVSWSIIGCFLITTGHFAALMALATHFYGVRQGYRPLRPMFRRFAGVLTLENALIGGGAAILASIVLFALVICWWSSLDFQALPTTLPLLAAVVLGVIGMQTALGGFLLSVIAGHEARFCPALEPAHPADSATVAGPVRQLQHS
jgi:hypothetical protein